MMDLIKKIKEQNMSESKLIAVCITLIAISGIAATSFYHTQKDRLMSANIENGIVKGVDPVAIKCAYEGTNTMCLVYAATKHGDSSLGSKK
jgi:hypothetical protein